MRNNRSDTRPSLPREANGTWGGWRAVWRAVTWTVDSKCAYNYIEEIGLFLVAKQLSVTKGGRLGGHERAYEWSSQIDAHGREIRLRRRWRAYG